MFSTTQLDLIEPMVQSMYEQGYIYYIAHTNTNLSSSYNSYDFVDVELYFSKEPINHSNYKFTSNNDVLHFECITRNVSNNQSDSKLERITYENLNSLNLSIPKYEHIMTNVDNSYFLNCLALVEYNNNNHIGYNLDLNYFSTIPILITVLIILKWFNTWFAKTYGGIYEKVH